MGRIAKIGERVKITMSGPAVLANTATVSGFQSISGNVTPITIAGMITGEEKDSDSWIVELDVPLAGNSRILIPKDIVKERATNNVG